MSETTRTPQHPADVITNLIVTLLTPMFVSAAGGDLAFARLAAAETLNSYRAETHVDLITIAKIIAFGLATLGSLSLSMADGLPIQHVLRLHNSANATDRSEHRNRLALKHSQTREPVTPPEHEIDAAALTAAAADMQKRTAENLARFSAPAPITAPTPSDPTPSDPAHTDAERHYQATWAAAAATIAAETAATLDSLSQQERYSAAIWIDALNDAAKDLMDGKLPPRPKPGDLAGIMRGV